MTQIIQIPDPFSPQFGSSVKQWIGVRDGIAGPAGLKPDRFVTVGDLYDPVFINALSGYQFPITRTNPSGQTGDQKAPRPPTNLVVTTEVFRNILTWDDPNSDNFWFIEVWRAKMPAGDAAPDVTDAVKIATVPKNVECFIDTEVSVTAYDHYYWIRAVSYAGIASLWQDGYIEGHRTVSAAIDNIMEILKGADPDPWSSIVNYVADDRVLQGGKRYKCILANLDQEPPNTTYWEQSGILIVGEVGGVSTVGVDGNLIVDGTIYSRCINVDDVFVGMTIQSTIYDPGVTGWQINANGDVDFTTGVTTWSMITGAGKPDDNADVTSAHACSDPWSGHDLDDLADGTYGKVLTTAISAGKIVLTSSGVSGTLPTSLSAAKCTDAAADQTSASNQGVAWLNESVGSVLPVANTDADVSPALPSDEHLVGYWPFDDGSGTVAVDGSGNGNDGTLTNMEDADWQDGVVGKCLNFDDGTNEYVDCGTGMGTTLGNGVTDISVSFWFKVDVGSGHGGFFNIGNFAGSYGELAIIQQSSTIRLIMDNADFVQNFAFTDTVSCHHCVVTYDGTTAKLYLDTVEKISHPYALGLNLSGLKTIIGGYYSTGFTLDGKVDEARVYDTALTESEIKALYLYPAGSKSPIPASLDNLPNGATYGRVALTSISAGKIIVAGLDSGITDKMFSDLSAKDAVEAWRHTTDVTMIDGGKIYANTITANAFISTLYGDLNQAMDYVKTVLGAGDEYEHDLTDTDLSNGPETNIDADTHADYGISVRISTATEWDDGGVWDTGTWDEPTDSSGTWGSAIMDLGSSKTLQMALRYTIVEETPASTTPTFEGIYSLDGITGGTNPTLDDGIWETLSQAQITGSIYRASGTLKTFRYFMVRITLATTVTTDRIILHAMTYLGNVISVFGQEVNKTIAAGGTNVSLSGFNAAPAITVTPIGATPLVPLITAQSSSSVTIKLYNLAGSAVGGNANITIIGV